LNDTASEADLGSDFDVLSELGSAFSEVNDEDVEDWEYLDLEFDLEHLPGSTHSRMHEPQPSYAETLKARESLA
jgi:hypothetical protein